MIETTARPRIRRGLWIAGLGLVLLSFGVIVHFVISGAKAGFPIEMISRGRSWIFIGGYLVLGYIGLLLLGFARPRVKPGTTGPLEPVDSTREVSRLIDDGPPSLPVGATEGSPSSRSNSDDDVDDEV